MFKSEAQNTADLLQGKFYYPFLIVTFMLQRILLAMLCTAEDKDLTSLLNNF